MSNDVDVDELEIPDVEEYNIWDYNPDGIADTSPAPSKDPLISMQNEGDISKVCSSNETNGAVVSSSKPELQNIAKKDAKPSPHISTSENLKEELKRRISL